jgi:hypothetical protein
MEAGGDLMKDNDAPRVPLSDDDEPARKAAADSLLRQIESLKDRQPQSLNEFAERKMIEERAKEKEDEKQKE